MLRFFRYLSSHPLVFAALFSAAAAAGSAVAAWKAYEVAQQQHDDFRNRIQFHFRIDDREDWSIFVFQISGEPYHIPRITITPTFRGEGATPAKGNQIPKSLIPKDGQSLPNYYLSNLRDEICEDQPVGDCKISSLLIEYDVYGVTRTRRLP